jgi:hypothetical protein
MVEQTKLSSRHQGNWYGELVLHMPPRGPLGLISPKSSLSTSTCVDCGHVHFRALSKDELLAAYEQQELERQPVAVDIFK